MRPVLALAVLALAACSSPDGPTPGTAPPVPSDPIPPADRPPMGGPAASTRPAVSLADLLSDTMDGRTLQRNLATPPRIEIETVPNRHVTGQTDTLRTFFYDGLALEFYEVAGGPVFLQEVTVTGEGYETAEGLGVGSTRAEVEAVYPNETGPEGDAVVYEPAGTPDAPNPPVLRVRYDADRAASLAWRFYVD